MWVGNKKCPRRDSNAQPSAPQAGALSIKLRGRFYKDCDSNPILCLGQGHQLPFLRFDAIVPGLYDKNQMKSTKPPSTSQSTPFLEHNSLVGSM